MKYFFQIFFLILVLVVLGIPGYTFFVANKQATTSLFQPGTVSNHFFILFRLFGLYALTLLWIQLMLGAFRPLLQKFFGGRILKVHITFGVFTLLFVTLHPLLFFGAYRLSMTDYPLFNPIGHYFGYSNYQWYGWLGYVAFGLLIITVVTARLRNRPFISRYWRQIHYGNYIVFILALTHSFPIGTEAQIEPMRSLYIFFSITFLTAFLYRRLWSYLKNRPMNSKMSVPESTL